MPEFAYAVWQGQELRYASTELLMLGPNLVISQLIDAARSNGYAIETRP